MFIIWFQYVDDLTLYCSYMLIPLLSGERDKKASPGLDEWNTEDVCWPSDWGQVTHHWQEL